MAATIGGIMETYYTAAIRPKGSKTWTVHPEMLYSQSRDNAIESISKLRDSYDYDFALATVTVEEEQR